MQGQVSLWGQEPSTQRAFDVVILHGHIVDGTGSPWYSGDVGIRDGRITAIGDLSSAAAKQKIEARGKVVAPGFIDLHCHLREPGQEAIVDASWPVSCLRPLAAGETPELWLRRS